MSATDPVMWSRVVSASPFIAAALAWWGAWSARRAAAANLEIEFMIEYVSERDETVLHFVRGPARIRRVHLESVTGGVFSKSKLRLKQPGDSATASGLTDLPGNTKVRVTCLVLGVGKFARILETPTRGGFEVSGVGEVVRIPEPQDLGGFDLNW